MKTLTFLLAISFITTSFSCIDSAGKNSMAMNNDKGFAVVELFTSEGCSSCPPADIAVASLLKEHTTNVYVLGYHVDYWDNLGWRDIFSNAAYTQLQRNYARAFKLSSVYTPQIVVNGTEEFVGSDKSKLNAAVSNSLQQSSDIKLGIDAKAAGTQTVNVSFNTDASNANIHVALIQSNAENKIQRGENTGATLHHVNIVRDIQIIPATTNGNVALTIPAGLSSKDCTIIAFTQNISDNKITAATEVSIQ
jgi:hypothetical protein